MKYQYGWEQVTEPAREPLTLEEAKLHLREDADSHEQDALILAKISAARKWAERVSDRLFITQDRKLTFHCFPSCYIKIPFSPVQSIVKIEYVDSDGVTQVLSNALYTVDTSVLPCRVYPAYNTYWPSPRWQPRAVMVTVRCGCGDYPRDVPENDRAAMLLMLGHLWENREASSEVVMSTLPMGAKDLLECEPRF